MELSVSIKKSDRGEEAGESWKRTLECETDSKKKIVREEKTHQRCGPPHSRRRPNSANVLLWTKSAPRLWLAPGVGDRLRATRTLRVARGGGRSHPAKIALRRPSVPPCPRWLSSGLPCRPPPRAGSELPVGSSSSPRPQSFECRRWRWRRRRLGQPQRAAKR